MQVLLTHVKSFDSKKGVGWSKFSALSPAGNAISFMKKTAEVPEGFASTCLDDKDKTDIFGQYQLVNVDFNEDGRIEEISV